MASRSSDMWQNSGTSQLPRSLAELIQIYSDMNAVSLIVNALDLYTALAMCMRPTERGRQYPIDHQYILIGFLPVRIAGLGEKNGEFEVDESVNLPGLTSSDAAPLEEFIPSSFWRGAGKVSIQILCKGMSSLLRLLKRVAENGV